MYLTPVDLSYPYKSRADAFRESVVVRRSFCCTAVDVTGAFFLYRPACLSFHRTLGELALQGTAVHLQRARRCRDIAVMFQRHFLEVFPFQSPQ